MIAASAVAIEFSVPPCDQLQRFENGSERRQRGPKYFIAAHAGARVLSIP
jgi:hypothetical protein